MWKRARRQNGFSRSNVPARIRIPKKLLIALEQEEAIEQGDEEGNQRHVWYDVMTNSPTGGALRQRRPDRKKLRYATNRPHISRPDSPLAYCAFAPMLDRSCVMLEYKLTIPCESWFTVVIRASPTAATIKAYSTRSWPCSSFNKRISSDFIFSSTPHHLQKGRSKLAPLRSQRLDRYHRRLAVQFRHQFQVRQGRGVGPIISQGQIQLPPRLGVLALLDQQRRHIAVGGGRIADRLPVQQRFVRRVHQGHSQIVARHLRARLQLESLLEFESCLGGTFLHQQIVSQVVMQIIGLGP